MTSPASLLLLPSGSREVLCKFSCNSQNVEFIFIFPQYLFVPISVRTPDGQKGDFLRHPHGRPAVMATRSIIAKKETFCN